MDFNHWSFWKSIKNGSKIVDFNLRIHLAFYTAGGLVVKAGSRIAACGARALYLRAEPRSFTALVISNGQLRLLAFNRAFDMTSGHISIDPDVFGGAPVFIGTRVPVAVLFENLADGLTLEEILDSYPTLNREAVLYVLKEAEARTSSNPTRKACR